MTVAFPGCDMWSVSEIGRKFLSFKDNVPEI